MSMHSYAHLGPYLWIPHNPKTSQSDTCAQHLGAEEPPFCPECGVSRARRYRTVDEPTPGSDAVDSLMELQYENKNERLASLARGDGFITLMSNISHEGYRGMIECGNPAGGDAEIEIGPFDRDADKVIFSREFADEIAKVLKAEPHSEIRWGLLFWYM